MAVSQINRAIIRPVTIAAAIIGTIEALAWTGLSLVAILYYYSVILIDDTLPINSYESVIYQLFLNATNTNDQVIVDPAVFRIFMVIILATNFVWAIISLYILWAMTRNRWKDGFAMVGGWSGLTLLIALLDVILMSLIAADFKTVLDLLSSDSSSLPTTPQILQIQSTLTTPSTFSTSVSTIVTTEAITSQSTTTTDVINALDATRRFLGVDIYEMDFNGLEALKQIVYTSYGIIMSLAARGYILLILNITFAIILMKFAFVIKNDEAPSLLPILDVYAASGRPWNNLYDQTDIGNGHSNSEFRDDNDRSIFPRSDSFITNDTQVRTYNPLSNGTNPYAQIVESNQSSTPNPNFVEGRLAKIGKKSGNRTPPLNVPPPVIPYIPDPDYSPTGSLKSRPKSVLRPKSNYVL